MSRFQLFCLGISSDLGLRREDLAEIHARALRACSHSRTRSGFMTNVICAGAAIVLMPILVGYGWLVSGVEWPLWPLTLVPIYAASSVGALVFNRRRMRPFVHQALQDMGYQVCEKCGYWLRGLYKAHGHCPECGAHRTEDRRGVA